MSGEYKKNFNKSRKTEEEIMILVEKFFHKIIELLVLNAVVAGVYIFILYMINIAWGAYKATYVGAEFMRHYEEATSLITSVLKGNLIEKGIFVTMESLIVCFAVSALTHFFHLARYLYLPMGFLGKIVLWGIPLSGLTAWSYSDYNDFDSLFSSFVICLFPVLCTFMGSFNFSVSVFPELETLKKFINDKKISEE